MINKITIMTINLLRRKKHSFTHKSKKLMMVLYQNAKKRADIVAQYDLTKSALDKCIKPYHTTGSFTAQGNRIDPCQKSRHISVTIP